MENQYAFILERCENAVATAFLSCSHDTEEHRSAVLGLSNHLRQDGVDASIDAYTPHPGEGWPKWMERQLRSDFLIIILSPRYIQEFNQEVPSSSGARFEGSMISSLLSTTGVSFEKVAIVCFDRWPDLDIPLVLHGCTRYYVDRLGEYEKLYAFLTAQPLIERPPLGNMVALRRGARLSRAGCDRTFCSLCKAIWPLMEENRRIFEDFGPNSGSAVSGLNEKIVRWDTSMWRLQRPTIGTNNAAIAGYIRSCVDIIPKEHAELFRKWLSHIEAFAHHLSDDSVDYREHQFPGEVFEVVRENL